MKTGRLSKAEWHYIEENADTMSPEEIASNLDREVDPIIRYLKRIANLAYEIITYLEDYYKSLPFIVSVKYTVKMGE